MSFSMAQLIPWLIPPVLGAGIGYLTNAVAIRMLFRPLTEKRFLGLRIPLTPGIIPKQREALAENIGRMVSEELITADALHKQVRSPAFENSIRLQVGSLTEQLLASRLGEIKTGKLAILYGSIETLLTSTLKRVFSSRGFINAVRILFTGVIQGFCHKTLEKALENFDFRDFLNKRLIPLLTNEKSRAWLLKGSQQWIRRHLKENTSLESLIPDSLLDVTISLSRTLLPSALESLLNWLGQDKTRHDLEAKGRILLKDVLDRLNNIQKFFVSVAQYDRTLDEKMPEIVEEALQAAREWSDSPEQREQMLKALRGALLKWRGRGFREVAESVEINLEEKAVFFLDRLFAMAGDESFHKRLVAAAERLVEANRTKQLGELIGSYLGLQEADIVDMVTTPVLNWVTKEDTSEEISKSVFRLVDNYLEDNDGQRIGELLQIDTKKKDRIDDYLTDRLVSILSDRLPGLVHSFDIRELVEEKINGLDVAQVEKLLLMVIAKHLKWINIFGAFLGAVIGFSQVVLRLIGVI